MSKLSQAQAELEEQASSLGFESIQQAEENGYRITYDNGKLKLVKRMKKVIVEIISWPEGWGLALSDKDGINCHNIAGCHGGGIGKTVKRFTVRVDRLLKYLEEYEFDDETESEDKK